MNLEDKFEQRLKKLAEEKKGIAALRNLVKKYPFLRALSYSSSNKGLSSYKQIGGVTKSIRISGKAHLRIENYVWHPWKYTSVFRGDITTLSISALAKLLRDNGVNISAHDEAAAVSQEILNEGN
ncbi:MAG: hypothetical protein WA766_05725 [Candidatus Acidiferrales bacterium]